MTYGSVCSGKRLIDLHRRCLRDIRAMRKTQLRCDLDTRKALEREIRLNKAELRDLESLITGLRQASIRDTI